MKRFGPIVTAVILLALPAGAIAGAREAAERVRQGIKHFRAGDYEKASEAFSDADVAQPENPWIEFDRACAYAAEGDEEKAIELFQKSALSRDPQLAVRSRYNLGGLAAAKAKAVFGEKPEEAPPEVRAEGLDLLAQAVGHYRDCLDLDRGHADARHNLEVIRLWIKHMQALWEERERQKQREEMDLLEFLLMIEAQERILRSAGRALVGQPDSPRRRQALVTTESSQRTLAEEIEPLKEKIRATLEPQQAGPSPKQPPAPQTGTSLPPETAKKAIELLSNLANEAREAMVSAADRLHGSSVGDAVQSQTTAVEKLDEIYMAVVPFASLVQRAIQTQQGLIDQVAPVVETPDEADEIDLPESGWDQRFVARWAEVLGPKAEQELKGLESFDPSAAPAMGTPPGAGPQAQSGAPDPEAIKKQMEGLKGSLQKAVELGPKVHASADEAATRLNEEKPADALPKQEEALKLLKEIAEELPKQDQQQQGDQQQEQKQDGQQQKQQSGQQEQREDRQQQDLSQQQAEAVLRKVRERQRERRELEKQLQRQMYRPGAVEKDW